VSRSQPLTRKSECKRASVLVRRGRSSDMVNNANIDYLRAGPGNCRVAEMRSPKSALRNGLAICSSDRRRKAARSSRRSETLPTHGWTWPATRQQNGCRLHSVLPARRRIRRRQVRASWCSDRGPLIRQFNHPDTYEPDGTAQDTMSLMIAYSSRYRVSNSTGNSSAASRSSE
jgi:hypothetical protein